MGLFRFVAQQSKPALRSLRDNFADPRICQMLFLGMLLASGAYFRDFSIRPAQIFLTFLSAILTQRATFPMRPASPRSYRSAIITAFSLTILLRADSLIVHPMAAGAAILSKSILRIRGKHIFNPAAFGLIFAITTLRGAWISPGQWGQDLALAGWMVALGATVASRANRADISWSFLIFYAGALAMRVVHFGYAWPVMEHQMLNGAILLFAFFMISDPMTAPNHRYGRVAHAATVAALAFIWQFHFFAQNGLIWAIVLSAPLVPLWDALMPAAKFQWTNYRLAEASRGELDEIVTQPRSQSIVRDRAGARAAA